MALTSKQRAALRSAANTMDPVYQIGKGEIDDTLKQGIADCIAARELIKVKVLEHISRFNLGFFQEHSPGQIKTTLFDDVDRVEQFLAHSTLELAQAIVVPLMMFLFMLRLH